MNWTQNDGEEKVIRQLAESCRGEDFHPAFGKMFLEKNSALLRELTGEPEWYPRYFAYKILLLDTEKLTIRCMEDGLKDPHPLIRKIITEKITLESAKTWAVLWDKLIHDPAFEVREVSRKRIKMEFMDRYNPKAAKLDELESVRVLELLDQSCQEDINFAMSSLESTCQATCYHAAVFLQKCGVLSSLLAKNSLEDSATLEYSVSTLTKALLVNVSGFLNDYPSGDGAPLLVISRVLSCSAATQENIYDLVVKVFAFFSGKRLEPSTLEIYTKTLEAVNNNGCSKSFEKVAEELTSRENDQTFLDIILPRIPKKAEVLLSPILFRFLKNTSFPAREALVCLLGNFEANVVLPRIFQILNGGQVDHHHLIRSSALKILARLHLPFCLQKLLESLPTLKPEELDEFANLLSNYPPDLFEKIARNLLSSHDAQIRASLITILPATKNTGFLKEIRSALKDIDPDVRVAAIKALLGYGEVRLLNQETSMLHDPVERVRLVTAEVIARHGNAAAMEILENIVNNPNETDVVKLSVISGLGFAAGAPGIKILVSVLDSQSEFHIHAENSLAMRIAKRDITQLIEIFRDAEPSLREKLIPVFKAQGKKAEPQILEILKDEVASFKPYLVKILEETGYIDEAKRRLSDRNVEERRKAALMLSLMDTLSAFRGLVIAAKDPDQEVRVCVVKALEKLKSDHSRNILEKLKEDPDSRIRKYTYWALERLDSLKME